MLWEDLTDTQRTDEFSDTPTTSSIAKTSPGMTITITHIVCAEIEIFFETNSIDFERGININKGQ